MNIPSRWHRYLPPLIAVMAIAAAAVTAAAGDTNQYTFVAQNDGAMSRMMTGMGVEPSGEIDRDVAAMPMRDHP